jgi:excisionase family DNA binding protein
MTRLTVNEAAKYLSVSRSWLDQLSVKGGGPAFYKLHRKILYEKADLDDWINSHKQASTADVPSQRRPQRSA